ncbi:hypothetical protein [Aliamphritea hakodatensis]|uniref:hypothetical protein n=1 Tax=Aliamphritea hakodatensis TaxID=2895352 RepID=UPI0022FD5255|nr:hypothetical protein [Aliamphritea hakodatensis]
MSNRIPLTDVELVDAVKSCTSCAWFWQGIRPYGPFPSFNWAEEFPEAIRDQPPQTANSRFHEKTHMAQAVGAEYIQPAVLRGCRKAPIMTVGINPNLSAFKPYDNGADFTYPWFDRNGSYAYYYRHASVFQERTDLEYMRKGIIPGSEIIARADGQIKRPARGMDHRWMEIPVQYDDSDEETVYELGWIPEERAVVFASDSFKKGDIIAAKTDPAKDTDMQLYAQAVGYYQRILPILNILEQRMDIPKDTLEVGEDVSMHDMIGCASPGWSDKYDIPQQRIASTCVSEKRFMFDQLIQSRPEVLIIVSNSSLKMFCDGLDSFSASIDLTTKRPDSDEQRDVFDLMKETCLRKRYVSYPVNGKTVKTRIIVTPHFSYGSNFNNQSRFSVQAWEAFKAEYPGDYLTLKKANKIERETYNGYIPIDLQGEDDTLKDSINPAAWQVLMGHHYEPKELVADALYSEVEAGNLHYDSQSGHLKRVSGKCTFCVNDQWQFPEGCAYGKA